MTKAPGYLHEVWYCPDGRGNCLPACIPHGPAGDAARSLNEPGSEWVWTFWASSHIQAMNIWCKRAAAENSRAAPCAYEPRDQ